MSFDNHVSLIYMTMLLIDKQQIVFPLSLVIWRGNDWGGGVELDFLEISVLEFA